MLVSILVLVAVAVAFGVIQFSITKSVQSDRSSGIDKLVPNRNQPTLYSYDVISSVPHDCNAFTQGLVYEGEVFFEGTGLTGKSVLRRVELESGRVLQEQKLEEQFFGEGIVIWEEKILQLTWQNGIAIEYDKSNFSETTRYQYGTEGWGLTHDGQKLIMSDGTSYLYFRDPETFSEIGRIQVTDPNGPVVRLNELEFIAGWVFANIWQTSNIAVIDPATGQVVAWIQLTDLLDTESSCAYVDVLNGIAYDSENDRLFVTGKLWPRIYQIELINK